MAKRVDGSLGTLLQGMSQQPDRERLQGQVDDLENMTSDPLRMLHRRPPTLFQAMHAAPDIDPSKIFVHFYARGDTEEYMLIVYPNDGNVYVYGTDGTAYTSDISAGMQAYLNTPDPKSTLGATTVGDYTFTINKSVAVEGVLTEEDDWGSDNPSRVSIVAEQYSRDYTLTVRWTVGGVANSVTATVTTPESTATDAEVEVSSKFTLDALMVILQADVDYAANFTNPVEGNTAVILPGASVESYTIEATDTTGGDAMVVINNRTVADLSALPIHEEADAVYLVVGGTDDADDFYMRFSVSEEDVATGSYFQEGIWVETQYGTATLVQSTMPHMLVRAASSTFVGGAGGETIAATTIDAWADRAVGDQNSNDLPDFVTQKIVDLAIFQNRLVFVYSEGVVMSVSGDFFNFWKKTVTALLADAPIGLSSAGVQVNLLRFAQLHNRDLVLFADKAQYTILGNSAITPQSATMSESTQFVMQTEVRPAASGQNLFFAVNAGVFSGVREFYTDSDLNSNNARPITIAVEKLIRGRMRLMSSSTNINKMVCMADPGNTAYLYEYLWEDSERLQSAWGKWQFRNDLYIFHLEFIEDRLSILAYDPVNLRIDICNMDISQDVTQEFFEGDILLDHRTLVAGVNTLVAGLDHLPADITLLAAVQGEGCPYPGMRIPIDSWDGSTATLRRDMNGGSVYVGVKFNSLVSPSQPFVRDASNRAIGTSQLTIGSYYLNFIDTGDFYVDVDAEYSYTERNAGRVLGQESATIGDFILTTGQFAVPVRARNDRSRITVRSDSPYPFTISDIEWDGLFYKRGKRITRP
jgi:hypothetical protein